MCVCVYVCVCFAFAFVFPVVFHIAIDERVINISSYNLTCMLVFPKVLHYQQTQGHMEHHDYFDPIDEHDFDSAKQGTNRFATIVMYFNDVESGGSTYFPYSPEVPSGLPSADIMLKNLREGDAKVSQYSVCAQVFTNFY